MSIVTSENVATVDGFSARVELLLLVQVFRRHEGSGFIHSEFTESVRSTGAWRARGI